MSRFQLLRFCALLLAALAFRANFILSALTHTVIQSDTLYGLSVRYKVPLNWIMRANNLRNDNIHPGKKLVIPIDGIEFIHIAPGDTLSGIALEFGVEVEELQRINNMKSHEIGIGQKIRIPSPVQANKYRVAAGDNLLAIARRYNLSVEQLKAYNRLDNDVIYPGQILITKVERPETYRIQKGESLWLIAKRFGLSVTDLKMWNSLQSDEIRLGDVLTLFPGLGKIDSSKVDNELALASIRIPKEEDSGTKHTVLKNEGEYFFSSPKIADQPSVSYWENSEASTLTDYRRAKQILDKFRNQIDAMRTKSNALKGWHIVIDPGHGGLDPGAIVSVADGVGNPLVITEDEYVYDISMRLYRILLLHDASVSLTVLSPDHHVRDGVNARQTFVNLKNEVYNAEFLSAQKSWRPVGTIEGLDMRKSIASKEIAEVAARNKRKGTIFVSLHADNSPELPPGRAVLYDGESDKELKNSMRFATALSSHLGGGAFIRHQKLKVLQNNPADVAALVEVRNISYSHNAWALRSSDLREQDALMIADGLLAWAREH